MTKLPYKKLPRDEERKRYALQRALPREMRTISKGTVWRCSQGVIFREHNGWFLSAHGMPWIAEHKTQAEFSAKPMALDPIFWDLVGIPENRKLPLSFREFGAWACRPPSLAEVDVPEENGDARFIAHYILQWTNAQVEKFETELNVKSFLTFVRQKNRDEHYAATIVSTLILDGREQEALSFCQEMKRRGQTGGFMVAGGTLGTLPELAIAWLTDPRRHGALQ